MKESIKVTNTIRTNSREVTQGVLWKSLQYREIKVLLL